jgi:hypothetical protein
MGKSLLNNPLLFSLLHKSNLEFSTPPLAKIKNLENISFCFLLDKITPDFINLFVPLKYKN